MTYTINRIQDEMAAAGSHWWDRDTMRGFGSRPSSKVYQGPGGVYFVTSEKPPSGERAYSVRQYTPATTSVDTVGEFCSMTRSQAHTAAAHVAGQSLDDQLDAALRRLDIATTGKSNAEGYGYTHGDIETWAAKLALSNYVTVAVKTYKDSYGYYLELGKGKRSKEAAESFNAAYTLQKEVCRVLFTEPAGPTAVIVQEAHQPKTDAEQLAIDIDRNGGHCNATQAAYLIRLATAHHRKMCDYCNIPDAGVFDDDGDPTPKLAVLRSKIEEAAAQCSMAGVKFGGDPRGCTVKLIMPNSETNDFGKEGWCVPIRG